MGMTRFSGKETLKSLETYEKSEQCPIMDKTKLYKISENAYQQIKVALLILASVAIMLSRLLVQ